MDKNLSVIKRRNRPFIKIFTTGFAIDVVINLIWQSPWYMTSFIALAGLLTYGVSSYLVKQDRFPYSIMYFLLFMVFASISVVTAFDHDVMNLLFFYFLPVAAALYPSWKSVAFGTLLGLSGFAYFALRFGASIMGAHYEAKELPFYLFFFVLLGMVGVGQHLFSTWLRKQSDYFEDEAAMSKEQLAQLVEQLKESGIALTNFSMTLHQTTQSTLDSSKQVFERFHQIGSAVEEQNLSLQTVAQHVGEAAYQSHSIYESSQAMNEKSKETTETIQETREVMSLLQDEVTLLKTTFQANLKTHAALHEKAKEVEGITRAMEEITNQVNLLALNASIEASRAGEAGTGFSSIAVEIRKLAESSQRSTKEIYEMLRDIRVMAESGHQQLENSQIMIGHSELATKEVEHAIERIASNNANVADEIRHVYQKMNHLQSSIDEINRTIFTLSSVSEENAENLHELQYAYEEINQMMEHMDGSFRDIEQKTAIFHQ